MFNVNGFDPLEDDDDDEEDDMINNSQQPFVGNNFGWAPQMDN